MAADIEAANVALRTLGEWKGKKVFLKDIWPSSREINGVIRKTLSKQMFAKKYADVFKGDKFWRSIKTKPSLTYAWDLDNNGSYETSGVSPSFTGVGQDGVFTVGLRVTDTFGNTATDTATVTVTNVAPSVTINAITAINEYGTVTVSGVVSDPGWLEDLSATIDFDDGAGAVALTGTQENVRPNATLTFSVPLEIAPGDSAVLELATQPRTADPAARFATETAVSLIQPYAPHVAEELWGVLGEGRLWERAWPVADPALLVDDEVEVVVQVNGKVRERITVPAAITASPPMLSSPALITPPCTRL